MSIVKIPRISIENRLLAALPSQAYLSLVPNLEPVCLDFKEVLYESRELIQHVYFPNNGVVSLLAIMADRTPAEVGLVGNEGMVGLPVFLGVDTTPLKVIVQVPGDAMRMPVDVFKDLVNQDAPLHGLLQRYTHALMFQISQSAVCNCHHSVEQRCCRWLLMTRDRVRSSQFPLTQEFLSQMLGVRRPSVTVVASKLQRSGLISYRHGQITVLDCLGLESASCECYRLIKLEFDR